MPADKRPASYYKKVDCSLLLSDDERSQIERVYRRVVELYYEANRTDSKSVFGQKVPNVEAASMKVTNSVCRAGEDSNFASAKVACTLAYRETGEEVSVFLKNNLSEICDLFFFL
jgi:hypothetical protein